MKFATITALIASAVALTSAAPNPAPQSEPINYLAARDSINNCGDSSFVNQSSGGSPRVSDCRQIAANIAGGGTWNVALIGHHQLVEYGTCAFGVQSPFELGITNIRIGNQDIIDLINSSIDMFQWNGLVGAKGNMRCQTDPGVRTHKTDWGIYHN